MSTRQRVSKVAPTARIVEGAPKAEVTLPAVETTAKTKFAKIVKATEKTPKLGKGWEYQEFVEWANGEQTVLLKEKVGNKFIYKTQDITAPPDTPDIIATDRKLLLDKVDQRWAVKR